MIYDRSGTRRMCDVCGGSGRLYEPIGCPTCNGSGLVPAQQREQYDPEAAIAGLFDSPEGDLDEEA